MSLSTESCVAAIERHSAGFAEASRGNLAARVEHCPEWSVADLVHHLTDVHWFWATIAGERLDAPPDESRRPPRATDDDLVDTFLGGADHLVRTLRAGDQHAFCWTWAPWQQDIAFVTRHQVQEAAVHHWDATHAAGVSWSIDPDVAVDSIDEFLDFSVPSPLDDDDPPGGTLDAPLVLAATDTGDRWTVTDNPERPGTLLWSREPGGADDRGSGADQGPPTVAATAGDLLLWLYQRIELDATDPALVSRFRALGFTD